MLGEPECGSGFESREVLVSPRPICDTTHHSLPTRWGVRPQSGPGAFFCLASVRSDRDLPANNPRSDGGGSPSKNLGHVGHLD